MINSNLKANQFKSIPTNLRLMIVTLVWPLIAGALYADGQLTSCDAPRLMNCQNDIKRSLQANELNSASIQYPIQNGPPYSPARLIMGHNECRSVRSNLDCLLQTTPACYAMHLSASTNTDYILRAKRFLEENGCNGAERSWRSSACFADSELRRCEDRFESQIQYMATYTNQTCPHYWQFKDCVGQHLRLNCKVHESDMINEYLIEKAGENSWRCPPNISTILARYTPSQSYQPSSIQMLAPSKYSSDFSSYDQRPVPVYFGPYSNSGANLSQATREQQWERFRNPYYEDSNRYGFGRYPTTGEIFGK